MLLIRAYAKVNLALSVDRPVPPKNYHPIASWFSAIDLSDTISLSKSDRTTLNQRWADDAARPSPLDWPPEKDLSVRANRLLEEHVGRRLAVAIDVCKRIPVGGGLGGGSSDAAAVLVGMNRLFNLGLSPGVLRGLSGALGSDIAFFIDDHDEPSPRPAIVTGFGEGIERTARVTASVLLVIPPFGCPTGAVYAALDARSSIGLQEDRIRELCGLATKTGRVPSSGLFNDLHPPACDVELRLSDLLGRLRAAAGAEQFVHMSGSGSTLFVLTDPGHTDELRQRLEMAAPECVVIATALI